MTIVIVETRIEAPIEECFDAARDIGLHCRTLGHTGERAVAGVTDGMIGLGQSVTFEGVHFGIRQRLTAKVILYQRPHYFVDEMTEGAFQAMQHIHRFTPDGEGTLMQDTVQWKSPLGLLGEIADALFLRSYMQRLIAKRGLQLKQVIEARTPLPNDS